MAGGRWAGASSSSLLGLTVLLGGAAGPAAAADLGGNCCADLEERIAELEATTARKGNRKVSLEIGGQVNQAIAFWDDGAESNAYIVTNDNSRTRFYFKGKAKIDGDWEAGYKIEIGVRSANSKRFTQDNATGSDNPDDVGLDLRDSYWYVKNKTYGALSVGQQATATDAITEINQTQTASFSKYSDIEDSGLGLLLRGADGTLSSGTGVTGVTWRRLIGDAGDQPGEGERRFNAVKYESPALAGFSVSAAWSEDDFWDVALRYTGELASFKIAAGVGYGAITDGVQTKTVCVTGTDAGGLTDCDQVGGSISILHDPTGLFVNFGAGLKTDNTIDDTSRFLGSGLNPDDEQTFYAVQAGIERKYFTIGKTTLYGEYYNYEGGSTVRRFLAGDPLTPAGFAGRAAIFSSDVESFGFGIGQGIDAAALTLYLAYRHYEADLTVVDTNGAGLAQAGTATDVPLEDLDVVFSGGIIRF